MSHAKAVQFGRSVRCARVGVNLVPWMGAFGTPSVHLLAVIFGCGLCKQLVGSYFCWRLEGFELCSKSGGEIRTVG
jgi:hypothetical protein